MSNAVKRRTRAQRPQGEGKPATAAVCCCGCRRRSTRRLARIAEEREVSLNQLITTLLGDAVWGEPASSEDGRATARVTGSLAVNIAVVAFAGLLAIGLLAVALSDVL